MQVISRKINEAGDVIRHEFLGPGEWMVVEAAMAGAGRSYCNSYPEAWKIKLKRVNADGSIEWKHNGLTRFQDTVGFPSNMILSYAEPVRNDRLALGMMRRKELVDYLRWMAQEIEKGSSVQAALSYSLVSGEDFNVNTAVRNIGANGSEETSFVGPKYVPEKPKDRRHQSAA